jgi:hypothetical protein
MDTTLQFLPPVTSNTVNGGGNGLNILLNIFIVIISSGTGIMGSLTFLANMGKFRIDLFCNISALTWVAPGLSLCVVRSSH